MSEKDHLLAKPKHRYSIKIDLESSYTEEIKLTWQDISVFVPPKKKFFSSEKPAPKQILQNVNGEACPGEILAIMGSSGAGKTTLINVLTQRNRGNLNVTGHVLANDQPIGKSIISLSAYVQQDDLMFANLTCMEHLTFQAKLRMNQRYTSSERKLKIREIMAQLGLEKCENTLIGGVTLGASSKGISGGEKKRLAIASELLTNPALMFLDEPTSGLDSFMAETVLTCLKKLALRGKTVICTIHQPSSEIFEMIDKLMLMGEGRLAYIGNREDAHTFFKEQGLVCPIHYNPADFFVHSLAIVPGREKDCKLRVKGICDAFEKSPFNTVKGDSKTAYSSCEDEEEAFAGTSMFKAGWGRQLAALISRATLSVRRNSMLTIVAAVNCVIIGVIVGLLYFQTTNDLRGVQNINGAIFLTLMQCTFPYIFPVINTFCPELQIFKREHWNGMYRTDTYFLSKMIAELPLYLIIPAIFTTIVYWMVGMNPDPICYLIFVAVCVLVANASLSAGYIISCASPSISVALGITPPLILPLILFGGIFLNAGSIPVYFAWLKYFSWFNYAYEILIVNQWSTIGEIICESENCQTPEEIIKGLSYSEDNLTFDYGMLGALIVGYRIIAYIILALKSKKA